MSKAHDEFCAVSDPFRVWMAEFIEDDRDQVAPCDETFSTYASFLRERGFPPVSKSAFGLELRKHKRGLDMKQRTVSGRSGLPWCYVGIKLKPKEKSDEGKR